MLERALTGFSNIWLALNMYNRSLYNQSDKKLAKKKIRKMIDEIDNCILNLMG